jgi:hypothetical protein
VNGRWLRAAGTWGQCAPAALIGHFWAAAQPHRYTHMGPLLIKSGSVAVLIAAAGCESAPPPANPPPALPVRVTGAPNSAASCQVGRPAGLNNGAITIRSGEMLCIQLQSQGDAIVPIALLESASPDTLVLTLKQIPTGTTLTVQNPLSVSLSYLAAIRLPGGSDTHHTSTCPVLSHRFGIESWPYQVGELTLTDFKRLPEGAPLVCK